jgi:hypothetical protein
MSDKKFPWGCVIGGCLALVVVVVAVVGGVSYFGYRKVREVADEMKDPAAREAKALDKLGAAELPEGYYPVFSFTVPFLADLVVLGDQPPSTAGEPEEPSERGFVYFSVRSGAQQRQELEEFFAGQRQDTEILRQTDINFRPREELGRGRLELEGAPVRWVTYRGELDTRHQRHDAIVTLVSPDCGPGSDRLRMGIWFAPDPAPDAGSVELDLAGTPADPEALAVFVSHFDLCG